MFRAPVTKEMYHHVSFFFFSLSLSLFHSPQLFAHWNDSKRKIIVGIWGKEAFSNVKALFESILCALYSTVKAQGFTRAEPLQLCPTLCNPMDCSPQVSVRGILQARVLEWIAMPSSRGSSQPRNRTAVFCISCIAGRFFTHWTTWEAQGLTQILSKRVLHLRGKPDREVHALAI